MADNDHGAAEITQLLIALSGGHREALNNLVLLVYNDLRRLAAAYTKGEPVGTRCRRLGRFTRPTSV